MSKNSKILAAVAGVLVLASVVLTMFGQPPNLPLGPLQGMLAGEDEIVAEGGGETTPPVDCLGTDGATPGATDPAAGAVDPTTGLPADPAADPAAGGAAVDPAAGGATDPAAGATGDATVTGAPASGAGTGTRIVAAGGSDYSWTRVSDTPIVAAEATDPATGLPVDPAADPAAADPAAAVADPAVDPATDPAATDPAVDPTATPVDPCADAGTGAVDPTTGAPVDPATGGATDPATGGTGAGTGTGADTGTGGTTGAAATTSTTDGSNKGNSPEALRIATDTTKVMGQAKIVVTTDAMLLPAAGGAVAEAKVKPYRAKVTAAIIVIKLNDPTALQQWTGAGKKVQRDLVQNFLVRMRKSYPKSSRSISVVDSSGALLAIGDATARAAKGAVKLY